MYLSYIYMKDMYKRYIRIYPICSVPGGASRRTHAYVYAPWRNKAYACVCVSVSVSVSVSVCKALEEKTVL